MINVYKAFIIQILGCLSLLCVIGCVVLWLTHHLHIITGWVGGCILSALYFSVLAKQLEKGRTDTAASWDKRIRKTLAIRIGMVAALTIIAMRIPGVDSFGLVCGVVLLPVILYGCGLVIAVKGYRKNHTERR